MQQPVLVENVDAWDILGGDLLRFGFIAEDAILEDLASMEKTLDVARLLLDALGREGDNPVEAVRRLGLKKPSAQTSNDRLILLRFLVTEFQLKKGSFNVRDPSNHNFHSEVCGADSIPDITNSCASR